MPTCHGNPASRPGSRWRTTVKCRCRLRRCLMRLGKEWRDPGAAADTETRLQTLCAVKGNGGAVRHRGLCGGSVASWARRAIATL